MCVLWYLSSISVYSIFAFVFFSYLRIFQIFYIIPHCKHHLVGHKIFFHQIKYKHICHFHNNEFSFFCIIRTGKHLPRTYTVVLRFICFYISNGAWFIPPRMIYKKFCIYPKQFIKKLLIIKITCFSDRTHRHIPHCVNAALRKFFRISPADPPEISYRLVRPQYPPVAYLI